MTEKKSDGIDITDVDTSADKKLAFTKTFTVEYLDPDTGKKLVGQFTVKRATLGDLANFGVMKSRLCGGAVVDRGIEWMNEMIAFCQATLTEFPAWWDPTEIYDQNLLHAVYMKVKSFQDSFRDRRVGEQRSAAAADSSKPAGSGVVGALVVQEVQPPT